MNPATAAANEITNLKVWCEAQTPGMEFTPRQSQSFDSLLTKVIGSAMIVHESKRTCSCNPLLRRR